VGSNKAKSSCKLGDDKPVFTKEYPHSEKPVGVYPDSCNISFGAQRYAGEYKSRKDSKSVFSVLALITRGTMLDDKAPRYPIREPILFSARIKMRVRLGITRMKR
jgi:hypothetical protein